MYIDVWEVVVDASKLLSHRQARHATAHTHSHKRVHTAQKQKHHNIIRRRVRFEFVYTIIDWVYSSTLAVSLD